MLLVNNMISKKIKSSIFGSQLNLELILLWFFTGWVIF